MRSFSGWFDAQPHVCVPSQDGLMRAFKEAATCMRSFSGWFDAQPHPHVCVPSQDGLMCSHMYAFLLRMDGLMRSHMYAFLLRMVWGPALARAARGYAGDVSAASALDLSTQVEPLPRLMLTMTTLRMSNVVLIDLRSAVEIAAKGSPQLPRGASKPLLVPLATVLDKRLRSQMSGAGGVEVQSTAMVIAALKKVTKGTTVLLLDRNGSTSKEGDVGGAPGPPAKATCSRAQHGHMASIKNWQEN
eukprot:1196185-Prorocentrum_minimum.AAC.2